MSRSRVIHPRTSRTRAGRPQNRHHTDYSTSGHHVNNRDTYSGPGVQDSDSDDLQHRGEDSVGSRRRSSEGRTLENHGAHYVLSPDSSKNSKLKSTARHEEQQYERHREVKREKVAAMLSKERPKAVGGPTLSEADRRELRLKQEREQQMEAKFAAVRQRQRRAEYHQKEKEKEDEELQRMKQTQREKAERLEVKQQAQQQVNLEEMRRARLARFDSQR